MILKWTLKNKSQLQLDLKIKKVINPLKSVKKINKLNIINVYKTAIKKSKSPKIFNLQKIFWQ